MKRKPYSILKIIVFMFLFMIPVCFSDWIYLSDPFSIAAANTDEVTVTIHTRQYVDDVVTVSEKKLVSTRTETDEKTKKPKNENDVVTAENDINIETGAEVDGIQVIVVTKQEEIITKVDKKSFTEWFTKYYKCTYTIALYEWTVETKKTTPIDNSIYSIKVAKGNTISPIELNIPNYTNYGYYADQNFKSLFDFSKPINSNADIYLKYYQRSSLLTQFINEKTNGTYSIYDSSRGGSNGQFDVSSDFAYDSNAKFDSLNQATIASGLTINFTYLDNQLCPSLDKDAVADDGGNLRDSKSNVALDYYDNQYVGNNNCAVMIRLNGDLTVKGTLKIGAKVGGLNAQSHFSEIIGKYTQLDLNGHNLIIDGGKVECYGSILDRTGGGKVIVKNNGTIRGLLTVTDGRGGNQATYGYGKGQSPFDEYRFAYIEAPIIAYYGTTVEGYLRLDLGSLGISNIKANIIGSSGASVFSWGSKKTDDDRLEIVPYINKNLYPSSVSNPTYKSIYTKMYYYRYKYNFKANIILNSQIPLNAKVIIKKFVELGNVDVKIDWARIGVPIPSFFDFKLFDDYSMTLKAKMLLLPGSSFITSKNSNLIFDPGETITYSNIKPSNLLPDIVITGETKRNCGGLIAYNTSFYSFNYDGFNKMSCGLNDGLVDFWNYAKPSNHMIMGKVIIEAMPDSNKYLISGPISLSKQASQTIISSQYVKTYDIKGEQAGSIWFSGSAMNSKASFNLITSFNVLPLISNGKAYIKDDSLNINGVFDEENGLFTAGNQTYFLWTPNDYLIGGSDKGNQKALTDYTVTPTLVESVIGNQIIKANGAYYLFYKGVFVPVLDAVSSGTTYTTIKTNLRKFCSNNNSELNSTSPNYDSAQLNYDSANKRWAFAKFN